MTRPNLTSAKRGIRFLAVVCVAALAGCSSTSLLRKDMPRKGDSNEPAIQMVTVWQPAQGRGLNGLPTRGLSGQLMFFTRRNPSPVIVEGEARVYLFDDQGAADEQARPIHQFDIRPEVWPAHQQVGTLGPTYQVFVPYPRNGREQVECSVQIRFTQKEGPVIFSEMTSVTLPGTVPKQQTDSTSEGSGPAAPFAWTGGNTPHTMSVGTISPADLKRRTRAMLDHTGPAAPTEIQQAAWSSSNESARSPLEERLERLEQLLANLGEQRPAAAPPAAHPLSAVSSAADELPATTGRRFQLRATAPHDEEATHPLGTLEPAGQSSSVPHRTVHPLADSDYGWHSGG